MKRDFAIIGMGYVGLPLARAAIRAGLKGVGIDLSPYVNETLNSGRSHVDDVSDEDVKRMRTAGFEVMKNFSVVAEVATVVICVPTPLAREGGPNLDAVVSAAERVADYLRSGTTVVLESTTWPGTTEEVVLPILERSGLRAGVDFSLAFSPERIDPGNPVYGVENTPKVVGGIDAGSTEAARAFYANFVTSVVTAKGTREAEMAKLLENTYRQINIALVNEMAKFSHEMGVDLWDIIRCASTKPFGFQAFYPGPGVGGHCIPIDPSYLSYKVQAELGYPFRFVELAQEINRSMPNYVVSRIQELLNGQERALRGARVLVLGVTYKAGIADQRESPAFPIGNALIRAGARVSFHDPFVDEWKLERVTLDRVEALRQAVEESDVVVLLQASASYDGSIAEGVSTPILDTRGVLTGDSVVAL